MATIKTKTVKATKRLVPTVSPTSITAVRTRVSSATKTPSVSGAKITHTFPDKTSFTGTVEQLKKVASTLGFELGKLSKLPRGYYNSESKGLIKISEMNDHHIRRAIAKCAKEYFSDVYVKTDTNAQFLKRFTDLATDPLIQDFYNELARR